MATISTTLSLNDAFSNKLNAISSALDKTGSKMGGFEKSTIMFKSMLGANLVSGAISKGVGMLTSGISELAGELNSSSKAWQTFEGNMSMLGHSSSEIQSAQKDMQKFATQTIYSASDMAQTYSLLAATGVKNTGQLVKGFGGLAAAAENPAQAMKTLSQQATQAAAKPNIAWQDFKLMLEQTPAGMAAVAKHMGMSLQDLVANVQDGKIKTEDFFDAIAKVGTNADFTKLATEFKTVDQAIDGMKEGISNGLMPVFDKLNRKGIDVVSKLSDRLEKINFDRMAEKLGKALDKINVDAIYDKIGQNIERTRMQFGKFVNAFKRTPAVDGILSAFNTVRETAENLFGRLSSSAISFSLGGAVGNTIAGLSALFEGGVKAFNDFINGFGDTGAFENIASAVESVSEAFRHVAESIGLIPDGGEFEGLGTIAGNLANNLADATKSVADFVSQLDPTTIQTAAEAVGLLVTGFMGFKAVTGVLKGISGIISGFGTAINTMSAHPILTIVAALAVAAIGFVNAYQNSEEFRNKVDSAMEKVKSVIDQVKAKVDELKEKFSNLTGGKLELGDALTGVLGGLAGGFALNKLFKKDDFGNSLFGSLMKGNPLGKLFGKLTGQKVPEIDGDPLGKVVKNSKKGKGLLDKIFGGVGKLVESMGKGIGTAAKGIGTGLSTAFKGLGTGIATAFKGIGTGIATVFEGIGRAASMANPAQLLSLGAAVLMIGAGALLAGIGVYILVQAAIALAGAGLPAAIAMAALAVGIILLGVAFYFLCPALTVAALGLIAFGAMVLMIGIGIWLACAGLSMLATQLPLIAEYGLSAAVGLLAIAGAMLLIGIGAIVAAVGLVLLAVGLVAVGIGAIVAAVGVLLLGVATIVLGAGALLVALALTMMVAPLMIIASIGMTAAMALLMLGVGLLVIGVGAIIAAVGLLLLGVALIVFAVGAIAAFVGLVLLAAGFALLSVALTGLGPAIESLMNGVASVIESVGSAIESFLNGLASVIESVGSAIESTLTGLGNLFESWGEAVKSVCEGVGDIITSIGDAISSVLDSVAGIFESMGNAALNAGKGVKLVAESIEILVGLPLADIVLTLGAVADGLGKMGKHSESVAELGTGMSQLGEGLVMIAQSAVIAVAGLTGIATVLPNIQTAVDGLPATLTEAGTAFETFATGVVTSLSGLVANLAILTQIQAQFMQLGVTLTMVSAMFTQFVAGVTGLSTSLILLGTGLMTVTMSLTMLGAGFTTLSAQTLMVTASLTAMSTALTMLMAGFAQSTAGLMVFGAGLMALIAQVTAFGASLMLVSTGLLTFTTALTMISAVTLMAVTSVTAFGASVTLLAGQVLMVTAGFTALMAVVAALVGQFQAITSSSASASSSVQSLGRSFVAIGASVVQAVASVRNGLNQILNAARSATAPMTTAGRQAGQGFGNGVANGISSTVGAVVSAISSMISAAAGVAQGGIGTFHSIGAMIGQGMASGMMSALGAVTAAANALVAQANRAAQAAAKIHSPSRLMRDEVGVYMGQGVAVGMERAGRDVTRSAENLVNSALVETGNGTAWTVDMVGQTTAPAMTAQEVTSPIAGVVLASAENSVPTDTPPEVIDRSSQVFSQQTVQSNPILSPVIQVMEEIGVLQPLVNIVNKIGDIELPSVELVGQSAEDKGFGQLDPVTVFAGSTGDSYQENTTNTSNDSSEQVVFNFADGAIQINSTGDTKVDAKALFREFDRLVAERYARNLRKA